MHRRQVDRRIDGPGCDIGRRNIGAGAGRTKPTWIESPAAPPEAVAYDFFDSLEVVAD
jgi:hypothetical protein